MEFLISFVVVNAICIALATWRFRTAWSGTKRQGYLHRVVGIPFLGVQRVEIGVAIQRAIAFEIRRQTPADAEASAKREFQTGDVEFDRRAYIASDDPRVHLLLEKDAGVRHAISELIRTPPITNYRFRTLLCRAGTVRAVFVRSGTSHYDADLCRYAVPHVRAIGAAIDGAGAWDARQLDRGFVVSMVLLGLALGFAVNGLTQLAVFAFEQWPFDRVAPGDWQLAFVLALVVGGAAALTFQAIADTLLARSAHLHRVSTEIFMLTAIGMPGTAFVEFVGLLAPYAASARSVVVLPPVAEKSLWAVGALAAAASVLIVAHFRRTSRAALAEHPHDADRTFLRALAFFGITSALAINGLSRLALLAVESSPPLTLDVARLWLASAAVGATTVAVLMFAAARVVGDPNRTYKALLDIATIGLVGATTTAFVELRLYNMRGDATPPVIVDTEIDDVEQRASPFRRSNVTIRDSADGAERTLVLDGSPAGFRTKRLRLDQRTGALGMRWIAAVEGSDEPLAVPVPVAVAEPAPEPTFLARCRVPGLALPYDQGELHVVDGGRETRPGKDPKSIRVIAIDVTAPGRMVLLLTTPDAVRWQFRLGAATQVDGVLATGHPFQFIAGLPGDARFITRSAAKGVPCGRYWLDASESEPLEEVTTALFGRAPDGVHRAADGAVTVGPAR